MRRALRIVTALILLSVSLLVGPASSVGPAPLCDEPLADVATAEVCPVENGFLVRTSDGSIVFSHGGDPIPAPHPKLAAQLPDPGVACVDESEPHIRVVYAWPSDTSAVTQARGEATRKPFVVPGILNANAILHRDAQEFGVEMRWKMLCDENGLPLVEDVTLSLSTGTFNFWDMASELQARGYGGANEKVLIFYDGAWAGCNGCGGWSYIPGGDEAGPTNWNNYGYWSYSAIFIGNYAGTALYALDEVILHEETHAMGGVQMSSPNSSGGWHCNDGWDIMCYADGGSTSWYGTNCHGLGFTYSGMSMPYDCGKDDYFHPSPAPGSYLDTHWNVGAAYNRFIERS